MRATPQPDIAAQIARWAEIRQCAQPEASWRVLEDADGSVFLIPLYQPEPAFAIVPARQEYEVLVCEPDSLDEIGPFASLRAALDGVSWWLQLPSRSVELPSGAAVGPEAPEPEAGGAQNE